MPMGTGGEVGMIAVVFLIVLVTVLSVYSAFGTYQNQQDIFVNDEEKYQIFPRYCPNCGRAVKWE